MNSKKVILVIVIMVIFIICIYFFLLNKEDIEIEIDEGPPEIVILETASSVSTNPPSYTPAFTFSKGDTIWLYQEQINISHSDVINFQIEIQIIHEDGETLGIIKDNINQNQQAIFYYINTNSSWDSGVYVVSSELKDLITNKISVKTATFYLL